MYDLAKTTILHATTQDYFIITKPNNFDFIKRVYKVLKYLKEKFKVLEKYRLSMFANQIFCNNPIKYMLNGLSNMDNTSNII